MSWRRSPPEITATWGGPEPVTGAATGIACRPVLIQLGDCHPQLAPAAGSGDAESLRIFGCETWHSISALEPQNIRL
jgi:hypothetical protein